MTDVKSDKSNTVSADSRASSLNRFSVAPMLDWTDRHCRYFLRQLTSQTLLYTEMV
ncbi:tRNA-dihydrouridine synthase, partial [Pectobacterium parmentieri]